MSPDRLRELAIEAAFHNHCENSHPESFDVCVHDDCVLVRSAAPALASGAWQPDHALAQLQQLSDLLQPLTQSGETIYETVKRLIAKKKELE